MERITEQALEEAGWRVRAQGGHMGHTGPLWLRRVDGMRQFGLLVEDKHMNSAQLMHGGMLMTLLDHAVSVVGWEAAGRRPCVTIQIDAQLRSAVRRGAFVTAVARVTRQARDLVFMEGRLSVGEEEVASGSAILKILGEAGGRPAA